jgi:glycosyltransferase involved in cell wall biosynthesis
MADLHVAHLVLGLPLGGTERLVERMVRTPPAPFAVSCICLDKTGRLGDDLLRDGFRVELMGRKPGIDWSLPRRIAAYAKRSRIGILHCHQYTPWFYGVLARLFRPSLKIIFTEHGRFYPDIPSPKRRVFNRLLAPLTHVITAVSPAVKDALMKVEAFPEKAIRVVYNGIESPRPQGGRAALRKKLGLREDGLYFVLPARFDPIKWIPGLLEAFAEVSAKLPQAGLLLIGDGPEDVSVRARISELGIADRVTLPGYQENVAEWLAAADVFVLSSHSEGTSVSLIESMALGLPAVATAVGGNPYVIEDGKTGKLVPASDAKALAAAMASLAADPAARASMGEAAKSRFAALFTLKDMFANYLALYRSLSGLPAEKA